MKPPVRGLMAGVEDQEAVERGEEPVASDTRQHDGQQVESTENGQNEEPNVSEEEQAAYSEFVTTGLEIMYEGQQIQPGILKLLDDDPADLIAALGEAVPEFGDRFSPVLALAATAVIVVMEIEKRLPEKPDGTIVMHGGKAILEDLANLGEEVNGKEFTQDEVNQAFLHAVDLYQAVSTAAGTTDKELASQEFADILNAQEKGELGRVLPGLEGAAVNG